MKFPILKRSGSVVVKVYRVKHRTAADGFAYTMAWIDPSEGRKTRQFGDQGRACDEAQLKADQLSQGIADSEHANRGDLMELAEGRRIAGPAGILPALREWIVLKEAAAAKVPLTVKRIKLSAAIDDFIADKEAAGKQGEKTYRAKLKPLLAAIGDVYVDTISAAQLTSYLNGISDKVTRNDLRKRAGTLFRWLRRVGYLPRGVETEIEHTERAKEPKTDIGVLVPKTYGEILKFFLEKHPKHLAAVVVAGFGGVRSDEIHGKLEDDRKKRQLWEDVDLKKGFLRVTNAKTNTPANRLVPLVPAALAWLKLCPGDHKGPISEPAAMERVRALAIAAGFTLPENCFRHSYISYDIALNENKAATAIRAGNSVQEIDRRYRVPKLKADGRAWFSRQPAA